MTMSTAAKAALFAQETDEALIVLITLNQPSWAQPLRLAQWDQDVTSRGNVYLGARVEVVLPEMGRDGVGPGKLALRVVTADLIALIRTINGPIEVTLEIVRAADPDTVELPAQVLEVAEIPWTMNEIEMPLVFADLATQRYPADIMGPAIFPGLIA